MSPGYDILPVTLVTGFLGSGKSTLLADVLHGDAAKDTAVLINEFGEVGLDHLLVGEVDARTVLLDNGCVCCSIRGELKEALATLFSQRARGDLPPFSRVVLETTGLATPAPIVATLLADPVIRSHYALNATVTVVDALNAAQQRARHPEWLAQVSAADRLLISKSDLVDSTDIAALAHIVGALTSRGYLLVAAVGNDGPAAPPLYPASYPHVVGVTAVDAHRRVLIEAARGSQVMFAAQGADMSAADIGGKYSAIRGTSFAAPIVAALLAQSVTAPDLGGSNAAIEALAQSAIDLGPKGRDLTYGFGLVGADYRPDLSQPGR